MIWSKRFRVMLLSSLMKKNLSSLYNAEGRQFNGQNIPFFVVDLARKFPEREKKERTEEE